ncbi:sulfotransferase family 2 domain-containing protein [Desulfonema magnum]|uniref:Sulfotransferase domain-containing protein n=1 Tax=Desulfonema magnum TaxID=45655 RepID=A0A975BMV4_9BACT|nr:sulfotransferase family 2 domain-containing protein [Desulfonema magnum]QTA87820.1 Sulfotransferase domain-containing protein [Desulfonema magnum]
MSASEVVTKYKTDNCNPKTDVSGKEIFHFLHIGKTGGTAVKYTLMRDLILLEDGGRNNRGTSIVSLPDMPYILKLHSHSITLKDIPEGENLIFFLRDPISRFVSSFYSRKRKGMPRYFFEWHPEEKAAFQKFETANELACSIMSEDSKTSDAAVKAMKSVFHVNTSFWDWFENKEYFLSRISDIFFIGFQESLDHDFERLKMKLGLPDTVTLPTDNVEAHKGGYSDSEQFLEEKAIKNLEKWYAKDYEFLKLCRKIMLPGDNHDKSN